MSNRSPSLRLLRTSTKLSPRSQGTYATRATTTAAGVETAVVTAALISDLPGEYSSNDLLSSSSSNASFNIGLKKVTLASTVQTYSSSGTHDSSSPKTATQPLASGAKVQLIISPAITSRVPPMAVNAIGQMLSPKPPVKTKFVSLCRSPISSPREFSYSRTSRELGSGEQQTSS